MKKLVTFPSFLSAAALMVTTGCMTQNEYTDRYEPGSVELQDPMARDMAYEGNLEVLSGHMRGDVGDVQDIDSEASLLTGYGDMEYANVEVHAETADGAAMNLVEIYGGLDALEPGMRRTFTSSDQLDYDELGVQVLNCAGGSRYAWDYDQHADEVVMEVSEGDAPGVLRVDYTARTFDVDPFTTLPTGSSTSVTGQFDVVR